VLAGSLGLGAWAGCRTAPHAQRHGGFTTRGVVLVPEDLTLAEWPVLAKSVGLTTIGLHHGASPAAVAAFVESESGARFLERCRELGLEVEYELHAMGELLPRDLFSKEPDCFRMDDEGRRTPDANCCVHSARGIETVTENAIRLARRLRPTTGRYFLWGDDGRPWCRCARCRELSDSEQALLLENHILRALRGVESRASLAHLAYANTIEPPRQVRPEPGIFLEFAPIRRRHDIPYSRQGGPGSEDGPHLLEANLAVFPAATAQVLEYWLDVSRASGWKRPCVELPWRGDVFSADI
jgi:hypothetical protein